MDPISKAIEVVGSLTALAAALHKTPQQVNNWRLRSSIPTDVCPDIEDVTNGAVRCEDMRPDVNWAVLRCKKRKAA